MKKPTRFASLVVAALLAWGPMAPARASDVPPAALGAWPFLWGVATSDYQSNGPVPGMDWYELDRSGRLPERFGTGPDFRGHMDADLDRAKSLGLNAFRTSIEWARLETQAGHWDAAEVAYTHRLLAGIRRRGMAPVITLSHFTLPGWAAAPDARGRAGWEKPQAVAGFQRFVAFVMAEYGPEIRWYLTFNEPSSLLLSGYLGGKLPPEHVGTTSFFSALDNILEAHKQAYDTIHRARPDAMVSFSEYNCQMPVGTGVSYMPGMMLASLLGKQQGWDGLERPRYLDYIGLHYYGINRAPTAYPTQPYHWDANPAHFAEVLRRYHDAFHLPILIAENGIATQNGLPRDDGWSRERFLVAHVKAVQEARAAGIPVIGYLYWTLTDNYEWGSYDARFGLWSVDARHQDLRRRETPAVAVYREIVKNDGVTPALQARYGHADGDRSARAIAP